MASVHVILIVLVAAAVTVNCDVNQIVKHCKEDWCNSLDATDVRYSSEEYHKKLIQFFSAGISQLIYQDASHTASISNISSQCHTAMNRVSHALLSGEEWAFKRK